MKVKNVSVCGMEESLVGSSYPMLSTDLDEDQFNEEVCNVYDNEEEGISRYSKGLKLAQTKIGSGHSQWLCGIIVQFDLTFSLKAWPELQRYHFIDFVSSQSTMHKLKSMDIKTNCNEFVDSKIIDVLTSFQEEYAKNPTEENFFKLIYNIPSGFQLTARMTTNYQQLKTIYSQRKNHRLKPDWGEFCKWIETLPNSELITNINN